MTTCPNCPRIDIITPNPGEYVASLLDRGLVDDAVATQSRQYVEGFQAAVTNGTVHLFEPVARIAGFEAGQEWLANGEAIDWLPGLARNSMNNYMADLVWEPNCNLDTDGNPINWFLVAHRHPHDKVAASVDREFDGIGKWRAVVATYYDPETDSDAICLGEFDTVDEAKTVAQLYVSNPGVWW